MQAATTFVATTTTETVAFLPAGSPNGMPPFALLDGVLLVAAPEPATWAVMGVGLVGLAGYAGTRRKKRAPLAG